VCSASCYLHPFQYSLCVYLCESDRFLSLTSHSVMEKGREEEEKEKAVRLQALPGRQLLRNNRILQWLLLPPPPWLHWLVRGCQWVL